jgi:hypothetical protein
MAIGEMVLTPWNRTNGLWLSEQRQIDPCARSLRTRRRSILLLAVPPQGEVVMHGRFVYSERCV